MRVDSYAASRRNRKRARDSRVWLNGEEVTRRCFFANTRAGVVGLYKINEGGAKFLDASGRVATEQGRGRVVVRIDRGVW
jgi:hypothetical protein